MIHDQKLGGVIVSVGGPIDIAVKTNSLQRAAKRCPAARSRDYDIGRAPAFPRPRRLLIPNAIDLGGATAFPYQMGLGATRDTHASPTRWVRRHPRLEGRAIGIQMAFAPVLERQQQSEESGHRRPFVR
jgi:beta-N-acetylhexosaminidase